MEKNNMTAVWWLAEQLFKDATPTLRQRALIAEAEEMEKKQNEIFFECGRNFQLTGEGTFTQVNEEIYGGEATLKQVYEEIYGKETK